MRNNDSTLVNICYDLINVYSYLIPHKCLLPEVMNNGTKIMSLVRIINP